MKTYLLILLVFVTGCSNEEAINKPVSDNENFIILDDNLSRNSAKSVSGGTPTFYTIDASDARKIIAKLPELILEFARESDVDYKDDLREVSNNLKADIYNLQLVNYKLNAHSFVFINGLDKRTNQTPDWRNQYKLVNDGGTSYWFAVYDIDNNKMTLVHVNGTS